MATGSTHTVRKSRTMAPCPYAIRGVAATEIMPQPSSNRNFASSPARHDVCDAVRPASAAAAATTIAM
jgi:hypothetical protein